MGFVTWFSAVIGSILIEYFISTVEGVPYAVEHNCFTEICPKMVASAVKILEEMG